ncbi:MAG: protein kinase domain-containing protein [Terriglobales bacterium]
MERYEVFERLGAGGLGEVYRARDSKLNRFVALKFLPPEASLAARERVEREAQAVAALNHPHICTLHETGEDNGRPFLVLELLEGETLQARLARGPGLGLSEASGLAWLPDSRGVLLTASRPSGAPPQVWEFTVPGGKLVQLTHDLQGYSTVTAAANGTLALVHPDPQYSVWVQSKRGGPFQAIPGGGGSQDGVGGLAWTPQGRILSIQTPGGRSQFWLEGGSNPPQPIAVPDLPSSATGPVVAPNGQIVFVDMDPSVLYRVNLDGTGLRQLAPGMAAFFATLVQDGKGVAFMSGRTVNHIYQQPLALVPLAGGTPRQVSRLNLYADYLLTLPGGKRVLDASSDPQQPGKSVVEEVALDGAPPVLVKPRAGGMRVPFALTPDGRPLAGVMCKGNVCNIWAAPLDGGAPYAITHFSDQQIAAFAFAPDGRLAVSRGENNDNAVLATGLGGKK